MAENFINLVIARKTDLKTSVLDQKTIAMGFKNIKKGDTFKPHSPISAILR